SQKIPFHTPIASNVRRPASGPSWAQDLRCHPVQTEHHSICHFRVLRKSFCPKRLKAMTWDERMKNRRNVQLVPNGSTFLDPDDWTGPARNSHSPVESRARATAD